jgi:uncharacterized cofD-like protein
MRRVRTSIKWLYPGMLVKRWAFLAVFGMALFLFGMGIRLQAPTPESQLIGKLTSKVGFIYTLHSAQTLQFGLILSIIGVMLCLLAFLRMILSLIQAIDPDKTGTNELVDMVYQRRKLTQGKRVVVIGGGTGLSTLLRGLKQYSSNLTAIVTVADDGGSSGKLVQQLNMLPPGDIRNCLVALADDETQMTELFQYRFGKSVYPEEEYAVANMGRYTGAATALKSEATVSYGEGLRDHAFGNLLIAAMTAVNRGDIQKAIRETSRVLNVRGRVLPSTVEHIQLQAIMEEGDVIVGETSIALARRKIRRMMTIPEKPTPADEVLEAIETADIIVLGPGSVFTSIIPNMLVKGVPEALRRSKARKVYVCNVMTQRGETEGFSVFDHINAIETHAAQRIFDYVLVNTEQPAPEVLERYRKSGAELVELDIDRVKAAGYRPILGNFINQTDIVRHNSDVLARTIMQLNNNKR